MIRSPAERCALHHGRSGARTEGAKSSIRWRRKMNCSGQSRSASASSASHANRTDDINYNALYCLALIDCALRRYHRAQRTLYRRRRTQKMVETPRRATMKRLGQRTHTNIMVFTCTLVDMYQRDNGVKSPQEICCYFPLFFFIFRIALFPIFICAVWRAARAAAIHGHENHMLQVYWTANNASSHNNFPLKYHRRGKFAMKKNSEANKKQEALFEFMAIDKRVRASEFNRCRYILFDEVRVVGAWK